MIPNAPPPAVNFRADALLSPRATRQAALATDFELPLESLDTSSLFGSGADVDELITGDSGVDTAALFRKMPPGTTSDTVLGSVAAML